MNYIYSIYNYIYIYVNRDKSFKIKYHLKSNKGSSGLKKRSHPLNKREL